MAGRPQPSIAAPSAGPKKHRGCQREALNRESWHGEQLLGGTNLQVRELLVGSRGGVGRSVGIHLSRCQALECGNEGTQEEVEARNGADTVTRCVCAALSVL